MESIKKLGVRIPLTWEAIANPRRNGHFENTGVKWIQWLTWLLGLVVFKAWIGLEKALRKFRHFEGVSGYDWEEAEYSQFEQKQKWVSDE